MAINYESARQLLEEAFARAEADLLQKSPPKVSKAIRNACEVLFSSKTQAYREVILGCIVARIQDKAFNIRLPYIDQGPNAFSGRSLDERVINPFLHDKRIPSSRGPYLSVFRRSVRFDKSTRSGLRDKEGYDAFLAILNRVEALSDDTALLQILQYILYKFAELREASEVQLLRLPRMSLEQYDALISALLSMPSGGRFPVLLVVATLRTIKLCFNLDWEINWQGINVADTASGAGGDITITSGDHILMVAEVTERQVDRSRVVATFNTKIAPRGIEEYLFFVRPSAASPEAQQQARQYFAQGLEVNFLHIKDWVLILLATIGKRGRAAFNKTLLDLLESPDVPKALKVTWNEQISKIGTG